jgi:hypothetical protein
MFCEKVTIHFFPEISECTKIPTGEVWLPLKSEYSKKMPNKGQVVIFEEK